MEIEIKEEERCFQEKINKLKTGLAMLREINTTCEKCEGAGKYLRPRVCAEDDRPDPENPRDYVKCLECGGSGVKRGD